MRKLISGLIFSGLAVFFALLFIISSAHAGTQSEEDKKKQSGDASYDLDQKRLFGVRGSGRRNQPYYNPIAEEKKRRSEYLQQERMINDSHNRTLQELAERYHKGLMTKEQYDHQVDFLRKSQSGMLEEKQKSNESYEKAIRLEEKRSGYVGRAIADEN